jgi:hypothetical protein
VRLRKSMLGQLWLVTFWDHMQEGEGLGLRAVVGVLHDYDKEKLTLLSWWPLDSKPARDDNSTTRFDIARGTVKELLGPLGIVEPFDVTALRA